MSPVKVIRDGRIVKVYELQKGHWVLVKVTC